MYRRSLDCLEKYKHDPNFKKFLDVSITLLMCKCDTSRVNFTRIPIILNCLSQEVRCSVSEQFKDVPNVNGNAEQYRY